MTATALDIVEYWMLHRDEIAASLAKGFDITRALKEAIEIIENKDRIKCVDRLTPNEIFELIANASFGDYDARWEEIAKALGYGLEEKEVANMEFANELRAGLRRISNDLTNIMYRVANKKGCVHVWPHLNDAMMNIRKGSHGIIHMIPEQYGWTD